MGPLSSNQLRQQETGLVARPFRKKKSPTWGGCTCTEDVLRPRHPHAPFCINEQNHTEPIEGNTIYVYAQKGPEKVLVFDRVDAQNELESISKRERLVDAGV